MDRTKRENRVLVYLPSNGKRYICTACYSYNENIHGKCPLFKKNKNCQTRRIEFDNTIHAPIIIFGTICAGHNHGCENLTCEGCVLILRDYVKKPLHE